MRKVLVTGGAGFIGSHLCDKLLADGHEVIAFDNLINGTRENISDASNNPRFTFVHGDIRQPDACEMVMRGVDTVYHLACLGVRHSLHSPVENHQVNADGTLQVLEAARKERIRRFFYISTSEISGDIQTFPITEDGTPRPKTVYGASKLAGENYAYSYYCCYGLDTVVLRIFNNYGPRAHHEGDAGEVIPRTIVNMLYGKQPVIFGDGSVTRDFYYVKDTARALAGIIDHKNITGRILNIGSGTEVTMTELLNTIRDLMGQSIDIRYLEDRPADVPRLWVDASRFRQLTGILPQVGFEQGLKETIAFYREKMGVRDLLTGIKLKNWEK
jgi:UDP-glucose 4-epimerase